MKISVKAKPGVKHEGVEKISQGEYVVSVKAPPVQGKANDAIREALAAYFGVSKSYVVIVSGHLSRNKTVEIIGK